MTDEQESFVFAVNAFRRRLSAEAEEPKQKLVGRGADWQDGFLCVPFIKLTPVAVTQKKIVLCSFDITVTLDWEDVNDADLDLYAQEDSNSVVFFGNLNAGALTLNQDAHPTCNPTPTGAEIVTGSFTDVESKTFLFWYNQYSACATETSPTVTTIKIDNTGDTDLFVNGVSIASGSSTTLSTIAYGGYDVGQQLTFSGATTVDITT